MWRDQKLNVELLGAVTRLPPPSLRAACESRGRLSDRSILGIQFSGQRSSTASQHNQTTTTLGLFQHQVYLIYTALRLECVPFLYALLLFCFPIAAILLSVRQVSIKIPILLIRSHVFFYPVFSCDFRHHGFLPPPSFNFDLTRFFCTSCCSSQTACDNVGHSRILLPQVNPVTRLNNSKGIFVPFEELATMPCILP